jgi:type III secretion protein N (ATPase)
MSGVRLDPALRALVRNAPTLHRVGRVLEAFGTTVRATGLDVCIGQACEIRDPATGQLVPAEVVGLTADSAILTPLRPLQGLRQGADVIAGAPRAEIAVGPGLLGRVVDALGSPQDDLGPIEGPLRSTPIYAEAPMPWRRARIDRPFSTGVRAIDALLSVGIGQRVGVFGTAGCGKSTLLGMLGRNCRADVNVIALVGERGREVREFIDHCLGPEGLARSVVVCATSDRPAIERVRAAHAAAAIAESYRAEGRDVLLLMDSVTRFARALREVGLAVGEPAVRRGFPPSVFAELPRLFERAGALESGSITAFYTILLEEAEGDPVGEEVRSILDGHIQLSEKLGRAGRFPAIDVGASASRLFGRLATPAHQAAAARVRGWLAKHAEIELLLQIGEYKPGGDPEADEAVARMSRIDAFLRQAPDQGCTLEAAVVGLEALTS